VAAGVCPLIHALGAGNSDSEAPRLGAFIPLESSTFRFPVPFAIVFWQTVSPSSIGGLPELRLDHFRLGSHEDVEQAVWLMRLSYLRYALKAAIDPHRARRTSRRSAVEPAVGVVAGIVCPKIGGRVVSATQLYDGYAGSANTATSNLE
jgi:hypothetical protein